MNVYELGNHKYAAENCIDAVLINPLLPDDFYTLPVDEWSDARISRWMDRHFIIQDPSGIFKGYSFVERCIDKPYLFITNENLQTVVDYLR